MILEVEFKHCDRVRVTQPLPDPVTLSDGTTVNTIDRLLPIEGRAVFPNIYAVRAPVNLDLPQVAPEKWEGATVCTAAILKRPMGTLIHFRAYLRCMMHNGLQPRLLFFLGTGTGFDRLENYEDVVLANQVKPNGDTHDAPHGIISGGMAILRRVKSHTEETTPEQRLAICSTCEHRIGDPQTACVKIKCCQRKEPDPGRWREAVQHSYGMCPLRKWGGDAKGISRIRETEIEVNGRKMQAVY